MLCFRIGYLALAFAMVVFLASASHGQTNGSLRGVVAITPSDAWAVGTATTGSATASLLAEHWDGTKWTIFPTPNPQGACSTFNSVSAISSSDVWAAGQIYGVGVCTSSVSPGVLEHWDGTAWSLVANPNAAYRRFTGVAAIASNDVWAVGYNEASSGQLTTLIEHWDGSLWSVVPSPNMPVQQTYFEAVTAVSTNDVWAVGAYLRSPSNLQAPFIEHWDGTAWRIVVVPSVPGASFLFGAGSSGPDNVWTTGYIDLAFQWQGSKWTRSAVTSTNGSLNGIAVFPDGEAWAVGYQSKLGGVALTLTEHFDGTRWSVVNSPSPSTSNNAFLGVSGTGTTDVWAVGQSAGTSSENTLIEHWDGVAWSIIPSP